MVQWSASSRIFLFWCLIHFLSEIKVTRLTKWLQAKGILQTYLENYIFLPYLLFLQSFRFSFSWTAGEHRPIMNLTMSMLDILKLNRRKSNPRFQFLNFSERILKVFATRFKFLGVSPHGTRNSRFISEKAKISVLCHTLHLVKRLLEFHRNLPIFCL